jgi:hypothetical protein
METLTDDEARLWCIQGFGSLRLTNEDLPYYKSRQRFGFKITIPTEFRRIAVLSHDLVTFTGGHDFNGGLIWLQRWDIGTNWIIRAGWRTLEDIRRAHGSPQSLEIAPAQVFRSDEFVEFHAFVLYIMSYEWQGLLLPRKGEFFADIRPNRTIICETASKEVRENLCQHLEKWQPLRIPEK